MMLTNMLCVLPASVEDARIDDGSHKSNSPKNAEATGISDTPQMETCTGLSERDPCGDAEVFSNERVFPYRMASRNANFFSATARQVSM